MAVGGFDQIQSIKLAFCSDRPDAGLDDFAFCIFRFLKGNF